MSFMKELISGVTKKFEVLETFFNNEQDNLDYKTRLDDGEIDDITYLHTLHEYMEERWKYDSPLEGYLERKKALRVSLDGLSRKEMEEILRAEVVQNEEKRSNWNRVMKE
jgi:hypothetical protein